MGAECATDPYTAATASTTAAAAPSVLTGASCRDTLTHRSKAASLHSVSCMKSHDVGSTLHSMCDAARRVSWGHWGAGVRCWPSCSGVQRWCHPSSDVRSTSQYHQPGHFCTHLKHPTTFVRCMPSPVQPSVWVPQHRVMAFAGDDPSIVTTKEGVAIATTPGGNPVAVYTDDNGNIFLIDPNGNMYYDTGDPQLGFYFVSQALLQTRLFALCTSQTLPPAAARPVGTLIICHERSAVSGAHGR